MRRSSKRFGSMAALVLVLLVGLGAGPGLAEEPGERTSSRLDCEGTSLVFSLPAPLVPSPQGGDHAELLQGWGDAVLEVQAESLDPSLLEAGPDYLLGMSWAPRDGESPRYLSTGGTRTLRVGELQRSLETGERIAVPVTVPTIPGSYELVITVKGVGCPCDAWRSIGPAPALAEPLGFTVAPAPPGPVRQILSRVKAQVGGILGL